MDKSIFRAYDIRGVYPTELNEQDAYKIARAVVGYARPKTVAVGRDARLSAPGIAQAVMLGLEDGGCEVTDLGMISSDMAVFAAGRFDFDLVVMVTASHNPKEWIGMKFTKRGGEPIGGAGEIQKIADVVGKLQITNYKLQKGQIKYLDILPQWIEHVLSFISPKVIQPFKVVVDAGNGVAGPIVRELFEQLNRGKERDVRTELVEVYFEPDGNFPNHLPSPIEPKNMEDLCKRVVEERADLGMAFDGDADRVFLVDETGARVSGSEMTAMVMDEFLTQDSAQVMLYNAICGWNVRDVVKKHAATAYRTRVGHGYVKKDMRAHRAYFAGEHSGHYFFKDNFGADSGLIAAMVVLALLSRRGQPLSQVLTEHRKYVSIPETNFRVADPKMIMARLAKQYANNLIDQLDGLTISANDWWANIRPSANEPLLRLNIEATTPEILERMTAELTEQITTLDRAPV